MYSERHIRRLKQQQKKKYIDKLNSVAAEENALEKEQQGNNDGEIEMEVVEEIINSNNVG